MAENQESANEPAQLNLDAFQALLKTTYIGKPANWKNELSESIDSTNNRALELAAQGAPNGLLVLAHTQTAGRGRRGNTWQSPAGKGIYASVILRPPADRVSRAHLPLYTFATGIASVLAIKETANIDIGLKWVNDLIFAGRKIGGILAEMPSQVSTESSPINFDPPLVIGIGINLAHWTGEVDSELLAKVDFLESLAGKPIDPNKLLASLSKHLEASCNLIESGKTHEIVEAWKRYSVTLGRDIRAQVGENIVEGKAVDVTALGGLVVRTAGAEQVVLHAGEISIRQADGSYA